jgi:hypothetical protein
MSVNFKNASIRNATISPRIVYDSSLVLALDPANPVSYPGTGDLSNNLIPPEDIFTLTNGAGYNSANGGVFTFAGDNDYIESDSYISYSLANGFTLMQWVKLNTYAGGTYNQVLSDNTNNFINFYFGGSSSLRWETHLSNSISSTSSVPLNTWTLLTGTMSTLSTPYTSAPDIYGTGTARIYLNGVLNSTPTTLAASPSININIALGSYTFVDPDTEARTLLPSDSSIGQTLFYTRELSAAEILQNYNALRYRYGV